MMTKRPALDYEGPTEPSDRPSAVQYWGVYLSCVVVGNGLFERLLARALWGQPGDTGVAAVVLLSILGVTILLGLMWRLFLRTRENLAMVVAAASGLGSFLPGYAVMYTFFG